MLRWCVLVCAIALCAWGCADANDDDDDDSGTSDDDDDDDDSLPGLPEGWSELTLDEPGVYDPRIALAADDSLRIVYNQAFVGNSINLASDANGEWATETVIDFEQVGSAPHIALGPDDEEHVSFTEMVDIEEPFDALGYCTRIEGLWSCEQPDQGRNLGMTNSVAVAADGQVSVLYSDCNYKEEYWDAALYYLAGSWGAWGEREEIGHGSEPSLSVTPDQVLHTLYFINSAYEGIKDLDPDPWGEPGELIHLSGESGAWQAEAVDRLDDNDPPEHGFVPKRFHLITLVADAQGALHAVYTLQFGDNEDYESFISRTKYATDASGQWRNETLCDYCGAGSLDVDPQGRVHLLYTLGTEPYEVVYAQGTSGDWQAQGLGVDYICKSLVADSQGYAHAACYKYIHPQANELKYLTNRP